MGEDSLSSDNFKMDNNGEVLITGTRFIHAKPSCCLFDFDFGSDEM